MVRRQAVHLGDVVSTFHILKKYFAGGGFPYVKSVTALGPYTVTFSFSEPFSPALGQVGQQVITPAHVWSKVPNPVKYTNPNPVGTGPFTQITSFAPQAYVLGKNPHYWQPGKPHFAGIRYPAYSPGSENEAIVQGTVDWGDAYLPNVAKTYTDKNPKDFHYWFAKTGGTIPLVLNTTMAPFNDVVVRKPRAWPSTVRRTSSPSTGPIRPRATRPGSARPRTGSIRPWPARTTGPRRTSPRRTRCSPPPATKWALTGSG